MGLPFQALAAWLFWNAFPRQVALPAEEKISARPSKGRVLPTQPLWLLALLLLPTALGQYYFLSNKLVPGLAAWFLALGLACFLKVKSPVNEIHSPHRWENAGLLFILGIAALMRFPFVGQHVGGFQIDEANNMIGSYEVLHGSFRSPFTFGWSGNQALPFFLYAWVLKLFGEGFAAARALTAVLSLAALYFFYAWCRMFSSVKASLTATFLLSVSWWFLFYSLSPFHNMVIVLFEILSFLFLERCFRRGLRSDFAFLGLFTALAFLGYLPGRLVPVMVCLVTLIFAAFNYRTFFKVYLRHFLLALFFFLLVTTPFFIFVLGDMGEFLGRSNQLSLMNEVQRTGHYDLILKRVFWTFTSFTYPGQTFDERFDLHNNPELDPLTGSLFYFGLLLAFLGFRRRWSWQVIVGFALGCAANAMAIQGPNPDTTYINPMRFFLVIPFLFLMGAQAIDWLFSLFLPVRKKFLVIQTLILVAAMGFSLFWNSRLFYVKFHQSITGWAYMGFNHIRVAELMNSNYPRCHIILDADFDSSTVQVLTHNLSKYTPLRSLALPLPYKADKNILIVFRPGNFDEAKLRQTYPNGVWGELRDPWNGIIVKTVEISMVDISASQQEPPTLSLP
jgi:hypothetical protein